eukprot:CAMPEP_0206809190 /NCGR_PEP_ID=MMETSP0975-20121206/6121_1 /ASSEMBLY_ACC=CAM_ASM_000399 /TAXON_ID=483370 /ORGANISM="non described non described, Strain CCMP2097" /LENGTH=197 /DNA_ID=CAMNT_0054351287 /DNA_START=33 /DNA_END=626 /DNA_ORIENTATION=+
MAPMPPRPLRNSDPLHLPSLLHELARPRRVLFKLRRVRRDAFVALFEHDGEVVARRRVAVVASQREVFEALQRVALGDFCCSEMMHAHQVAARLVAVVAGELQVLHARFDVAVLQVQKPKVVAGGGVAEVAALLEPLERALVVDVAALASQQESGEVEAACAVLSIVAVRLISVPRGDVVAPDNGEELAHIVARLLL